MLNYSILESKPIISKNQDGSEIPYKDLLSNSLNVNIPTIDQYRVIEVTEDYIARPDLISLAVYGDDGLADIICKINGISNPFELNEGMTLIIPNLMFMRNFIVGGKASQLIKTPTDQISAKENTNRKNKSDRRSPAEQTIGDTTFIIDRTNKIVYY